jgi:hypothetical protein
LKPKTKGIAAVVEPTFTKPKLGARNTVSEIVAALFSIIPPPAPLMLMVYVPGWTNDAIPTVIVDVPEPGAGMD